MLLDKSHCSLPLVLSSLCSQRGRKFSYDHHMFFLFLNFFYVVHCWCCRDENSPALSSEQVLHGEPQNWRDWFIRNRAIDSPRPLFSLPWNQQSHHFHVLTQRPLLFTRLIQLRSSPSPQNRTEFFL